MGLNALSFFISHAFQHDRDRQLFHERLERAWPKGDFYRVLEPSRRHHERELSKSAIKRYLRDQLRQADVVIVVAAQYAVRSEWMLFEIQTARRLKKPIVLVRKPGARCPKKLVELCGVQPTELDSLRWKITQALPSDRLEILRSKVIENALSGGGSLVEKPFAEDKYPWARNLKSIAKEWPPL